MSEEKIYVESKKEQFVPAEFSLLLNWGPILEKEKPGTGWLYLLLQTYINRVPGNANYGKAFPSIPKICEKLSCSSPTVYARIKILEKYGFVKRMKIRNGSNNKYLILPVPDKPDIDKGVRVKKKKKKSVESGESEEIGRASCRESV